jgi:hypothetical protein
MRICSSCVTSVTEGTTCIASALLYGKYRLESGCALSALTLSGTGKV